MEPDWSVQFWHTKTLLSKWIKGKALVLHHTLWKLPQPPGHLRATRVAWIQCPWADRWPPEVCCKFSDTQGMKSPLVRGVAQPMQSLNNDIICNKGFAKAHPEIVADHRKASLILIGECILWMSASCFLSEPFLWLGVAQIWQNPAFLMCHTFYLSVCTVFRCFHMIASFVSLCYGCLGWA